MFLCDRSRGSIHTDREEGGNVLMGTEIGEIGVKSNDDSHLKLKEAKYRLFPTVYSACGLLVLCF